MEFITREDPVDRLKLSNRFRNCLTALEIDTVGKLLDFPEDQWPNVRNMGAKTIAEAISLCAALRESIGADEVFTADLRQDIVQRANEFAHYFGVSEALAKRILAGILEQHPGCIGETLMYYAYDDATIRGALKNKLLNEITLRFHGMPIETLHLKLPAHLVNTTIVEEVLLELESAGKLKELDGKYLRKYPSVLDYIANLSDEKKRIVITERLNGKTLEEVGLQFNMTRERTRQICVSVFRNCPIFEEDQYKEIYLQYDFTEENFCEFFSESAQTYYYLEIVASARGLQRKPIVQMLSDETLPVSIKKKAESIIYRNYITVGGVRLPKIRAELFRHIVKLYCKEKTTFADLVKKYDGFLLENGLQDEESLQVETRSYENKAQSADYVLWNRNHSLRYYNITERDYTDLVRGLNIGQYQDKEISTLKLLRDQPELMQEYDIRDEYELHSLLRKIWDKWGNCDISFSKMPTINVGNPDRDDQVLDLMLQCAPISNTELAQRYEETYGIKAATVLGYYFRCIDDYFYKGMYTITQESLSREQFDRMQEVLINDFYTIVDIQRIFEREFPGAKRSLVNSYNLKTLGFSVYVNYVVSKKYSGAREYFESLLTTQDIVDTNDFPVAFSYITLYSSYLHEVRQSREIIEFEPKKYINRRRLETIGITMEMLEDYCKKARSFLPENSFFTITSLRQDGFSHDLDDLYFDEWFYSSLLAEDHKRFSFRRMGGTRLLYTGQADVQMSYFLEWLLEKEERMELDDLVQHLNQRYGIDAHREKLLGILKDTSLYYDTIMDTVYIDYDTYFEEV